MHAFKLVQPIEIGSIAVAKKFPIHPANPERNCWGCDQYCSASAMACGNGSDRTQHPVELFGEDWHEWEAPGTSGVPASNGLSMNLNDPNAHAHRTF